jgi:hypothetical protein
MEGSHIIDHKVQLKFQMQGIGMESRWKWLRSVSTE